MMYDVIYDVLLAVMKALSYRLNCMKAVIPLFGGWMHRKHFHSQSFIKYGLLSCSV